MRRDVTVQAQSSYANCHPEIRRSFSPLPLRRRKARGHTVVSTLGLFLRHRSPILNSIYGLSDPL